jgi:hypothetical protein
MSPIGTLDAIDDQCFPSFGDKLDSRNVNNLTDARRTRWCSNRVCNELAREKTMSRIDDDDDGDRDIRKEDLH